MGGDSPQALFYKRCHPLNQDGDGSFNDSRSSTLTNPHQKAWLLYYYVNNENNSDLICQLHSPTSQLMFSSATATNIPPSFTYKFHISLEDAFNILMVLCATDINAPFVTYIYRYYMPSFLSKPKICEEEKGTISRYNQAIFTHFNYIDMFFIPNELLVNLKCFFISCVSKFFWV
jgi:hypothetical protein